MAHLPPPPADTIGRKRGRVVVDAHVDPTLVIQQVVHAVGNRLAQFLIQKVMNAHFLRIALRSPLVPAILEIPDQFLLFRVHGDGRLAAILEPLHQGIDVLELCIAVWMRRAFSCFSVALQAVASSVQQGGHRAGTHRMLLFRQFVGQTPCALARPTQRRLGVAASRRFDQALQRGQQFRVAFGERAAGDGPWPKPIRG